jgi:hypothetical protein
MKLEFLDDISDEGRFPKVVSSQLLRLYDFTTIQAESLREVIAKDIVKANKSVNLSSLDFIEPVNCNLIFHISEEDEGLITHDNKNFICAVTIPVYVKMVRLIEPFCNENVSGYQWLYDLNGSIDLLFSSGGTW